MKLLINLLLLLAAFTFTQAHAMPTGGNVFRAQFTTQVKDREPTDNLRKLENAFTSVYFFTEIRECKGCKIEHVWYLDNNHVYTHPSTAKYPRHRTWSKKTLSEAMLGTWTVKVKINGKVKVVRTLEYFAPSAMQIQQAPMNKRMMLNQQDQCEIDLEKWHKLTNDDPTDHYYKYMFDKVGKRCYGE